MEMFKKILSFVLVAAITAGVAISGTVAYLQDQEETVNVMTLGNVDIEQHEYQRVANEDGTFKTDTVDEQNSYVLEEFEQGKPLYPIVGDPSLPGDDPGYAGFDTIPVRMSQVDSYGGMDVFAGKNAQDKFVTVKNVGKSDAYIRTLVAIEIGTGNAELIGTSYHLTWSEKEIGAIEIDGNNYYVIEYTYAGGQLGDGSWRHENGILPAGDTSYPSLAQVYLKSAATNEDCEAFDGNKNGTLDILVLSQAIQTAGFDAAQIALDTGFGMTTEENIITWFGGLEAPVVASTEEELKEALAEGKNIILEKDITLTEAVNVTEAISLNLNGFTLSTIGLDFTSGGEIENGTVASADNTNLVPHLKISGGEMVMNNVTVDVAHHLNANADWSEATGMEVANATAVLNNCNISIHNGTNARWVFSYGLSMNIAEVTINGGSITATCVAGTAANGPTNPNAISSIGKCTVNLNNVTVDAMYYATTVNGHLTINTTDTNVTKENVVDNRGGSHTINYVD